MKIRVLCIMVLVLLVAACGKPSPPKYIFLLTLDTTREDAVHLTPGNPDTPHLAAWVLPGI